MANLYTASAQWATRPADERFNTLDDMATYLRERKEKSAVAPVKEYSFEAQGNELLLGGMRMSNWAFDQLHRVQVPVDFIRRLPAQNAAADLNYIVSNSDSRMPPNVLSYNKKLIRAFTGSKYQLLWDDQVINWVQDITKGGKWYRPKALDEKTKGPSGLYAGDRDIFVFMVNGGKTLDDDSPEGLGRGIFVWNTEVYGRTFGFQSFLFRRICGNHIVWDASEISGFSMRHFGQNFTDTARKALSEFAVKYMESAPIEQKAINAARKKVFAGTKSELAENLAKFGIRTLVTKAVDGILTEGEQEMTFWNVMNALTATSQRSEYADARTTIDTAAGKILAAAL